MREEMRGNTEIVSVCEREEIREEERDSERVRAREKGRKREEMRIYRHRHTYYQHFCLVVGIPSVTVVWRRGRC